MSEHVICLLSDSEESVRSTTNDDRHDDPGGHEEGDFDFPSVGFTYHVKGSVSVTDKRKHDASSGRREIIPRNDKSIGTAEDVDDDEDKDDDSGSMDGCRVRMENMRTTERTSQEEEAGVPKQISGAKRPGKEQITAETTGETKAQRVAREKALKALERQRQKQIQPGECLKFMQVCLDEGLKDTIFYLAIVDALINAEITWEMKSLSVANSIVWIKKTEELYISRSNEVCARSSSKTDNQMIIIWSADECVCRLRENSFVSGIRDSLKTAPSTRPTLVLYGMENYFADKKRAKTQARISRQELEICLAEIQLTLDCSSQLVDTPQDLGSLVYRFTKSIAEIPYKTEKRLKLAEKLDWYASGDNRDTVRVDNSGNGLKRLWQQQLCQMHLASLEIAQAITSVYSSPFQLMEAYRNCTSSEGEKLLKDITIRRAAGPLSTARKIGPELSKKIFIMFTSKNGEAILSNEKNLSGR